MDILFRLIGIFTIGYIIGKFGAPLLEDLWNKFLRKK